MRSLLCVSSGGRRKTRGPLLFSLGRGEERESKEKREKKARCRRRSKGPMARKAKKKLVSLLHDATLHKQTHVRVIENDKLYLNSRLADLGSERIIWENAMVFCFPRVLVRTRRRQCGGVRPTLKMATLTFFCPRSTESPFLSWASAKSRPRGLVLHPGAGIKEKSKWRNGRENEKREKAKSFQFLFSLSFFFERGKKRSTVFLQTLSVEKRI